MGRGEGDLEMVVKEEVVVVAKGELLKSRLDQWISGSVEEGAPTEEPRPDASNARRQRPATRATGVSRDLPVC
jgi:hypothetical protein